MSLKLACEGVRSEEVACCRSSPLTLESYIRGSNGEGNDIYSHHSHNTHSF